MPTEARACIGSPRTRVMGSCKPPNVGAGGGWGGDETGLGSLEDQKVVLTAEASV